MDILQLPCRFYCRIRSLNAWKFPTDRLIYDDLQHKRSLSSSNEIIDSTHTITSSAVYPYVKSSLPQIIDDNWKTTCRLHPSSNSLEVRECHLCHKGNREKPDNLWKLKINNNGSYYCFRCSAGGNWAEFKEKAMKINRAPSSSSSLASEPITVEVESSITMDAVVSPTSSSASHSDIPVSNTFTPTPTEPSKSTHSIPTYNYPDQEQHFQYHRNLFPAKPEYGKSAFIKSLQANRKLVKSYLHDNRKLNDIVLRRYGIGFTLQQFLNDENEWKDHVCITFPWIIPSDQVKEDQMSFKQKLASELKDDETAAGNDSGIDLSSSPVSLVDNVNKSAYIARMKYR
jgi:hypothetical protein